MDTSLLAGSALVGLGTWCGLVLGVPLLIAAGTTLLPVRSADPRGLEGRFRDVLRSRQCDKPAPTLRELASLTWTWVRAFSARKTSLMRAALIVFGPGVLARLALCRVRSRRVLVQDRTDDGVALLTLRLAPDGSWWLADFAAWPPRRGHAPRLMARVLAAADAHGVTVRLEASNRALAERYYTPLGFVSDARMSTRRLSHGGPTSPSMTRAPVRIEEAGSQKNLS